MVPLKTGLLVGLVLAQLVAARPGHAGLLLSCYALQFCCQAR
jgi:hypothetical protein